MPASCSAIWMGFNILSNLLLNIKLFLVFSILFQDTISRTSLYINVYVTLTFSKFVSIEMGLLDLMVFWSLIFLETHTHNPMMAFLIRNITHVPCRTFWKYRKSTKKGIQIARNPPTQRDPLFTSGDAVCSSSYRCAHHVPASPHRLTCMHSLCYKL